MSKIERTYVKVPKGFNASKIPALTTRVREDHGDGWAFESFNVDEGKVVFTRESAMLEVRQQRDHAGGRSAIKLDLRSDTKASDGDKIAARMADAYPGYVMIRFDPHLRQAILAELTPDEARCRDALANALGVKPWDVMVRSDPDGGFAVGLPNSYMPSKHDDKMQEVAETVVGELGWYVTADPKALTAKIVPANPPTFDPVVPYPMETLGRDDNTFVRLGVSLGHNGEPGEEVRIEFDQAPHIQVSGTTNSGKSVLLNATIAQQLAAGSEFAVIDLPHKAVDFTWCKPYVRPGGWGCESIEEAVACMAMIYEEGMRRADLLKKHNVQKIAELPANIRPRPIYVLLDEVTGLIQLDDVPKGIPKDHPLVTEAMEKNLLKQTLLSYMKRFAAELRFVGVRMLLSSQVSSVNTGIPTALRMNLSNKILQGPSPTDGNRRLSLTDPTRAPKVPDHIRADAAAARGVGVAELEGKEPVVYKAYFGSTADYAAKLQALGVPTTDRPRPTPAEISAHTPGIEMSEPAPKGNRERSASTPDPWETDEFGTELSGFERANAARHAAAVAGGGGRPTKADREEQALASHNGAVASTQAVRCEECGGWVNPSSPDAHRCAR